MKSRLAGDCYQFIRSKEIIRTQSLGVGYSNPGPEVIELVTCSAQLSMKIKLLVNSEIAKISINFWFKSQKPVIYPANEC